MLSDVLFRPDFYLSDFSPQGTWSRKDAGRSCEKRVLAQVVGQALTCCFLPLSSQKAAPQGALDMLLSPGSLCSCPSVLACL